MSTELKNDYSSLVRMIRMHEHDERGKIITVNNSEGKDVYNPALVIDNGKKYLAIRIESPESFWLDEESYDPEIRFYEESASGNWVQVTNAPVFKLHEDPFSAWIEDEQGNRTLVVGGVTLDRSTNPPTIVTQFFKGTSIQTLSPEPFLSIRDMKDIRLVQCEDKKIIVCVRPQGGNYNKGQIGVIVVNNLYEIEEKAHEPEHLFINQIDANGWIGSNELYVHKNENGAERIDVLGHIAHKDEEGYLHYAAIVYSFDPDNVSDEHNMRISPKVIAVRGNFEVGPAKTEWLEDVVFPGSLEFIEEDSVILYAGLSDARIGTIKLPNPFI